MTVMRAEQDLDAPTAVLTNYLRRSISISEIVNRIWSGKLIIASATAIGIAVGTWQVHVAGPQYITSMSIAPAEGDVTGGGGGGGGAAGLLADLTGGSNTAVVPKFTQFLAAVYSVSVAKNLEARYGGLCRIYTGECDQVTRQWRKRTGVRPWIDSLLAKIGGLPDPNGARTADDLASYIGAYVVTETSKKNAIVTLTFIHGDPKFAANFLSSLVTAANDYIRLLNRETQRRYVDYLSQASIKTTNVQQRQTIDTLLLQQERQLMMTEVDAPYAATILDGPNVEPINRVARTIVIFGVLGGVLGSIFVLFRHLIPSQLFRLRTRRGN